MNMIEHIKANEFALVILCSATLFAIFWLLDSLTHGKLVKIEITEKELQTHRIILLTSICMEVSLVLFFWFDVLALPIFLAFFITRTVHEFIDELHWHTDRCSAYESMLHLGMWISILTNTFSMFLWGFFTHYRGWTELNVVYFIWAFIVVVCIFFIGLKEWKR
jgi:hypothetical protein